MHPNTYLRTFWRGEVRPSVFVAMGSGGEHDERFTRIIQPAIEEDLEHDGARLKTLRVDLSKSGDAVLTEMADAITHSAMVLADISTSGWDAATGKPHRNENVMCAVGMALACRQPAEVLLICDDRDPTLFDVSTVPRMRLNFSEIQGSRSRLAGQLRATLREVDLVHDARVHAAVASMTAEERQLVAEWGRRHVDSLYWLTQENAASMAAFCRLLDKELIRTAGVTHDGHAMFTWTMLGKAAAASIDRLLPVSPVPTPPGTLPPASDDGGPRWVTDRLR